MKPPAAQPRDFATIPPIPFRELGRRPSEGYEPARSREHTDASATAFPETFKLLDDVELMNIPDPEWIVSGVIPRRSFCIVYGPPGSCKTVLMANLAVAIATGRNWFGHQVTHRGASIYVAAEDTSGWKVRLRAAKRANGNSMTVPLDVFTFPEAVDLLESVSVERFIQFVRAEGEGKPWLRTLECVIVDTYAAATVGGDENSSEDTSAAVTNARRIMAALNCSVVLVHHPNASGSRERGHSGLRAAADAMIELKLEDTIIRVQSQKMKNGPPFEALDLRLDTTTHGGPVLRFGADMPESTEMSDHQRNALRVLCQNFSADGATKTEWMSACNGMAPATFFRVTKVLQEKRAYVTKNGSNFRATPTGREAVRT
jgi:KaiC/GvpD/RAD55 family RecA-like ATPase